MLCAVADYASAATCPVREIKPEGNFLHFNGYTVQLEGSDQDLGDPGNVPLWDQGLLITPPGGKQCSVALAIIEPPFFVAGNHTLYVDTYSGSEHTQFLVDARDCSGTWSSPQYIGPPRLEGADRFIYEVSSVALGDSKNESFTVKIGPDCMPGKPVTGP